jgi:hypothetical protein
VIKVFASIPKVKGTNLMNGVVFDEQWYVDQILSCKILKISV